MGQTMGNQVSAMDFSKLQIYANFLSQANYARKKLRKKIVHRLSLAPTILTKTFSNKDGFQLGKYNLQQSEQSKQFFSLRAFGST